MTQHQWVKLTQTRLSILPDLEDENQVVVIEDPDDVQAAEDGAVFGCKICNCVLEGNSDTLCSGVPA